MKFIQFLNEVLEHIGFIFMYNVHESFNYTWADRLVEQERKELESTCTENSSSKGL